MRKLKTVASLLLAVVITGLSAITPAFADYDPGFDVDAEAVYFINLDTGKVIYEKDADKKVYPASTTKIMTALLALENIPDLDTPQIELKLYIQNALSGTGASLAGILRGETFTPRELLYAALLPSGNEAAMMLGDYVGDGSLDYFAEMMNEKAAELGAVNTHFVNASGMHDDDHYTTAYDMYLITMAALENETFREIVSTNYYYAGEDQNGNPLHWNTTNFLISPGSTYYYPYATGVKTGTTDEAGRCLVSTAEKDGYHYLMVMMGAPQYDSNGEKLEENMVFKQTIELYDWAFSSFSNKTLIEKDVGVGEVPLKLARGGKDYLLIKSGEVFTDLLPNEIEASSITMELDLPAVVNAPIKEGDQVGTIRLMLAGEEIGSVPAVAAEDVDASLIATLIDQFKRLFRSFLAKFIVVFVILSIIAYITITVLRGRNKNRYYRRRADFQYNIIVIQQCV